MKPIVSILEISPLRSQENKNALQVEGFGQNQHIYCEQLTKADTHKNHLAEIQTDLY